jgi:hypothetical protein
MFGAYPIGEDYKHRPSEDDSKLDIDVNSPLSDEEGEEDDDDFRNIKFLIGKNKNPKHPRKDHNISQTPSQNEIEKFLSDNNLS